MRSGNGRHRRPRQAPAIVVAAGVTGSAIALPLLGAGSASAADAATWDRVAECESGGMWSADLGNGFYGGLQLSQQTWEAFGGTAYAPSADLASRSQQIAVAEKVLDAQGPDAWQACAPIAGLTNDDVSTGVDPGDLLPLPDASPEDAAGTGSDTTADAGTDADASADSGDAAADDPAADAPDRSQEIPAPDASPAPASKDGDAPVSEAPSAGTDAEAPDSATGTGRHRGEPAPDDTETGITDEGRESGRHASRGDASARDGATVDGAYTVQPGDTLWAIADEREVPGGWSALYEANEKTVGADPDLILPGQSLDLGLGDQ